MRICSAENELEVATCRSTDLPYVKDVNYTTVIDGFIISDNIEAYSTNIENNYLYSDHQPVLLHFKLKD
ncbi:MAG: endonuclease/exonuclease/phosphatase [Spirochaetaceae bacterium]|nr:endonuclease/exonuclease/phosphatase [Spirochaetaceae bacterium]